ncbi:MAG: type III pantothenate kinase [Calditrichaeota bacterium]|nr:type III pantothenate kinase [Calditrichota bacterium]
MLLAIDVGNTHIEIGLYEGRQYRTSWRITTGVHRTEDEFMAFIHHFLSAEGVALTAIDHLIVSSVVPDITQQFIRVGEKYFHQQPMIIDHTLDLGIRVDYHPPSSVGADRLCNAVAAFEKYGGPAIIVDFGTATTFDVVSEEGVYIGGAIAPGVETTAWGLHERASKLPRIALEFPEHAIGKSTEESMQSGIVLGSVMMVDGLIAEMEKELKTKPHVIATGGLAHLVASRSRYIQHVEDNLVLEGMVQIYFRNLKSRK